MDSQMKDEGSIVIGHVWVNGKCAKCGLEFAETHLYSIPREHLPEFYRGSCPGPVTITLRAACGAVQISSSNTVVFTGQFCAGEKQ